MNPDPIPDYFKLTMLVYCADPSHTTAPVGPIITDPYPVDVAPDDLYVHSWFVTLGGANWYPVQAYATTDDPNLMPQWGDRAERELLDDGTLRPSGNTLDQIRDAKPQTSWSPRCRRCGARGGRWKATDRDELFTRLADGGVTGISLRQLDLYKHRG
jgi:hypothetical protein